MKFHLSRVAKDLGHQIVRLRKKLSYVLQLLSPSQEHQIGMFAGSLLAYESWAEPKIPH